MAQKKIGAKIVIDGEHEFRSALQQSKNALKEFDSELKLVTTQFKNNEKSMESLRAKQAVYQKQQAELVKQSKILVDQIKRADAAYKSAEEAQTKQTKKIKDLEKALDEARKTYGDSSEEVERLERELSEANDEYEKQDRQITALSNKITKWNTELNNTQIQLVETDRALEDTNRSIENFDADMDEAGDATKDFGLSMKNASDGTDKLKVSLGSLVSAQLVVDVLRNCARAVKEVATAAIEVGAKFEASMSNVEALSGASGDSLERLGEKAREMGSKTIYSASESADAFSYMALAGWDVEQMLSGIEPVLNLAASANMDLAEASDIVTDYITAFGLKASDAAHFSDAMAKAMSTSNTTVELLGESYKNCAATCGSMGIAMEDATAVLATMANAGVKGGEAGTALNAILTRLATNTKGAADKLEEYGVKVYDSQGKMNSISSILNGLSKAWGDMSQQEQAALSKTVAGVSQYSKFQTIMLGVSEAAKEGGQSFDDYAQALRDCDGAAESMAKTMQDNLTGDITILKSALEGLGIATEGVFDASFRTAVQGATDAVSRLERAVSEGDLGVSLSNLGDSIAELTLNLMDAAEEALPSFIDGLTWIVDHIDMIASGIKTVVASYAAYKIATVAATISTESFTAALMSNPFGAIAVAITATTVALIEYNDYLNDANNFLTEEGKTTVRVTEETKELNEAIREASEERAAETKTMEIQANIAKQLVAALFDENTSQAKKAEIIAQLKELYPKLNIAMDEYGNIIGATRGEVEKYIDVSLQMAKVEAAKEHLSEIAKEQFEAEQELVKIQEQKAKAIEDVDAAIERSQNRNIENSGWAMPDSFDWSKFNSQIDASQEINAAKEALQGLEDQEKELQENIDALGDEYEQTMNYIGDTEPLINSAEATDALADAEEKASAITEELAKEFEELYESISQSINSSLDLTKKWTQEWDTSTKQMTDNVNSQIEGIQNWSDNFDKLANNAEVQIDQRVLKYLADMGVEGAGLVQELVDTLEKSPDQLADWSESMGKYLTLEDSVAAEITNSYTNAVVNGIESAKAAMSQGGQDLVTTTGYVSYDMAKAMAESDLNIVFAEAGTEATGAMAEGMTEGSEEVSEAAEETGAQGATAAKEKKSDYYDTGREYGDQIGKGIKDSSAQSDAEGVAKSTYQSVASILTDSSGYEIGQTWMAGLIRAIEEEGAKAIAAAEAAAAAARAALAGAGGGGAAAGAGGAGGGEGAAGGAGGGGGIAGNGSGLFSSQSVSQSYWSPATERSPYAVNSAAIMETLSAISGNVEDGRLNSAGNTNVNVELTGDAKDIFSVVRTQNTKLITATGYHALS